MKFETNRNKNFCKNIFKFNNSAEILKTSNEPLTIILMIEMSGHEKDLNSIGYFHSLEV
jgi:hypothetical protein